VAEGVETSEEMTALQGIGADHVQGYLLSRALEPAALSTWAREHAATESIVDSR
jgi:EAL domain-containing protein (putative c-di-GMP-specific phosphodiesterase class I)